MCIKVAGWYVSRRTGLLQFLEGEVLAHDGFDLLGHLLTGTLQGIGRSPIRRSSTTPPTRRCSTICGANG